MNMQSIMAQAQKMQRDLQKKREELNSETFIGKSDWIQVTFNGKKELISVKILYQEPISSEDFEMLEDMFMIATKDAMKQIDDAFQEKMGPYSSMFDGLM